jgi:hypothetical protein
MRGAMCWKEEYKPDVSGCSPHILLQPLTADITIPLPCRLFQNTQPALADPTTTQEKG